MNRLLPIALFAALSGSAWAECPPGVIYNPRIGCDLLQQSQGIQFPDLPPPKDFGATAWAQSCFITRHNAIFGGVPVTCMVQDDNCPDKGSEVCYSLETGLPYQTSIAPAAGIKDPSTPPEVMPVPPPSSSAFTYCTVMPDSDDYVIVKCVGPQSYSHRSKAVTTHTVFGDSIGPADLLPAPAAILHHYTLDDLDRMRAAIFHEMTGGIMIDGQGLCLNPDSNGVLVERPGCRVASSEEIENRLHTYVAAGIRPEELEARAK